MKRKILLVEDNEATQEVMQVELGVLGYEVAVASNGAEAIGMAISYAPDLILMDIHMPKMDGLEAASQIRSDPKSRSIPILAATAGTRPGDREKCLANGFSSYLAKPFTHHELAAAIKSLLK